MKKRARKIQVWLACVFAVILLWNLGQVEAKASTAQEDNLVIIYGVNAQGEAEMASNGLLISSSKGNPYVVAAASSHWEQMDKYYVEGPAVEQQEINFKGNKAEAGVSVFQTNLSKGACESSEIAGYDNLSPYQLASAEGIDLSIESDSMSDKVSSETTMIGSEYSMVNDRRFVKLEEEPSGNLIGGPIVLDDGRVEGIQVNMDDGYYWFLTMDEVVDILQENSDGEIGGTPMDDSKIFLYMIPVFAVVFLLSVILYSSSEKKRIAAGKKEFANVLVLGGESGLQLRGIGGHFNDIKFPLEGKIIFGRDSAQCSAVYPKEVKGISRLHCSVEIKNGKVLLMDLGSTYGTFLSDGTKLEPNKPYYLNYGQSFYLVDPANTFRIV